MGREVGGGGLESLSTVVDGVVAVIVVSFLSSPEVDEVERIESATDLLRMRSTMSINDFELNGPLALVARIPKTIATV